MSLFRFIAIKYPIFYRNSVTRQKMSACACALWVMIFTITTVKVAFGRNKQLSIEDLCVWSNAFHKSVSCSFFQKRKIRQCLQTFWGSNIIVPYYFSTGVPLHDNYAIFADIIFEHMSLHLCGPNDTITNAQNNNCNSCRRKQHEETTTTKGIKK